MQVAMGFLMGSGLGLAAGLAAGYLAGYFVLHHLIQADGYQIITNRKVKVGSGYIRIWKINRATNLPEPMPRRPRPSNPEVN